MPGPQGPLHDTMHEGHEISLGENKVDNITCFRVVFGGRVIFVSSSPVPSPRPEFPESLAHNFLVANHGSPVCSAKVYTENSFSPTGRKLHLFLSAAQAADFIALHATLPRAALGS